MKYGIYRFKNCKNDIIYVGKTDSGILGRISTHFQTKSGHLPEECYRQTVSVEYIEFSNSVDTEIYETYYINKYKPKYNSSKKYDSDSFMQLPELEWTPIVNSKKNSTYNDKILEINKIVTSLQKELNKTQYQCDCLANENAKLIKQIGNMQRNEKLSNVKMFSWGEIIKIYKEVKNNCIMFRSKISNDYNLVYEVEVYFEDNYVKLKDRGNEKIYVVYDVKNSKEVDYLVQILYPHSMKASSDQIACSTMIDIISREIKDLENERNGIDYKKYSIKDIVNIKKLKDNTYFESEDERYSLYYNAKKYKYYKTEGKKPPYNEMGEAQIGWYSFDYNYRDSELDACIRSIETESFHSRDDLLTKFKDIVFVKAGNNKEKDDRRFNIIISDLNEKVAMYSKHLRGISFEEECMRDMMNRALDNHINNHLKMVI